MYDNNMKFVATHEWVKIVSDNVVSVGITHHAQELLGDIVYVELPKVGKQIGSHDVIGVVESVKAASDLYSPLNGEVIEINAQVVAEPTIVNTDPHVKGWLFKIKLNDKSQLDKLMSKEEYVASIGA